MDAGSWTGYFVMPVTLGDPTDRVPTQDRTVNGCLMRAIAIAQAITSTARTETTYLHLDVTFRPPWSDALSA